MWKRDVEDHTMRDTSFGPRLRIPADPPMPPDPFPPIEVPEPTPEREPDEPIQPVRLPVPEPEPV